MTDEQARRRALDPEGSFIVQAPAGSGKTSLLVQRLLVLLARVDCPERILALTFTRKAAGEMRERVIQALREAGGPEPEAPHAAATWRLARAALARDEALGWRLTEQPGRMRIMTIDAFCHALAAQLPLLSGFGGMPAIADDAGMLYREAAEAAIERMLQAGGAEARAAETMLLHLGNRLDRLIGMVAGMLGRRDQWLPLAFGREGDVSAGGVRETLAALARVCLLDLEAQLAPAWKQELMALAAFACGQTDKVALASWQDRACWPAADPVEGEAWRQLAGWLMTKTGGLRKRLDINTGFPPKTPEKDRMLVLLETMADTPAVVEALARVRDFPWHALEDGNIGPLDALWRLLVQASAHLALLFGLRGECDFIEIGQRALEALGGEDAPGEVLLRLDWRLQHILIDEFQDTSRMQIELLRRLTAGWQPDDGRTLFLVGDPMQSIYRFRKAEVGLFVRAAGNELGLPVRLESLALERNFRSLPGIVAWVNEAFAPAFPARDDATSGAVRFHRAVAARQECGGVVRAHLWRGRDDAGEARAMADLIEKRRKEDANARIGVLCRNRAHLAALVAELARRGVRFRAVELMKLAERPEVRLLRAMTRAMLHPADDPAWIALLRAPFPGLSLAAIARLDAARADDDGERLLWPDFLVSEACMAALDGAEDAARLRRWRVAAAPLFAPSAASISLSRRIEAAWLRLGMPAWFDDAVARASFETWLALLDALEARALREGARVLPEWLDEAMARLHAPADGSPEAAWVELSTMHAAKGLEWDMVLLPGLGKKAGRSEAPLLAFTEVDAPEREGFLLAPAAPPGADAREKALFGFVQGLEKRKDEWESLRLFYVAATRARRELHLFGHVGGKKETPQKGSLLDWIWQDGACGGAEVFWHDTEDEGGDADAAQAAFLPQRMRELPAPQPPASLPTVVARVDAEAGVASFVWAGPEAAPLGEAMHLGLKLAGERGAERWRKADAAEAHRLMRRALLRRGLSGEMLEEALQRAILGLEHALASERGRWILSARHADAHCEWALIEQTEAGEVREWILDRAFVADGVRWIVDYKAATHEGGGIEAFLASEAARHRAQLANYARLLRRMEPEREVRAALYFPMMDRWLELEGL